MAKIFVIFLCAFMAEIFKVESCLPGDIRNYRNGAIVELQETRDPATAVMIYNEYGVNHTRHVCDYVDKETSRIFGQAVCKQVVGRLYPEKANNVRALCQFGVRFEKDKYDIGLWKIPFVNIVFNDLAKCEFGEEYKECLFVLDGPHDFYYVFELQEYTNVGGWVGKRPEIIGVLDIKISAAVDFPAIQLKETTDPYEADNIFGIFGAAGKMRSKRFHKFLGISDNQNYNQDKTSGNHVCDPIPGDNNSKNIIGKEICELALRKLNKQMITNVNVICVKHHITRRKLGLVLSGSIQMAQCWYSEENKPKSLFIFNASQPGYYFVAKFEYGAFSKFCKIISCLQISTSRDSTLA